ncbi:MAG: hypothetical protein ACRCYU_03815 [Nocardioides sp.]
MRSLTLQQCASATSTMAIAVFLGYVGEWTTWLGVWRETQHTVGVALILGLPAAVGIGAWLGVSQRRNGLELLTAGAGRSASVVVAWQVGEAASWVAAGFALGAAPAYLATALVPHAGSLTPLPVLAQLAIVVGGLAIGTLVGRKVPSVVPGKLVAPIVAILTYVMLGVLSFNAEFLLIGLTPIDERSMTFDRLQAWVYLTRPRSGGWWWRRWSWRGHSRAESRWPRSGWPDWARPRCSMSATTAGWWMPRRPG